MRIQESELPDLLPIEAADDASTESARYVVNPVLDTSRLNNSSGFHVLLLARDYGDEQQCVSIGPRVAGGWPVGKVKFEAELVRTSLPLQYDACT